MIELKGPFLGEKMAVKIARQVFTADRNAIVTLETNGESTVVIKSNKLMEVLNALDLIPRSLLPHESEDVHVRILA